MDKDHAKVVWNLYVRYGIGSFDNWLLLRKDNLDREEVVSALKFDDTLHDARKEMLHHQRKIDEIKQLILDSKK